MSTISSRRYVIAVTLLAVAVAGALLRAFAVPESSLYYLGTLLMVMWIPIVGNIISFISRKFRRSAPARRAFPAALPFVPHASVQLNLSPSQGSAALTRDEDGTLHFIFLVGTEGFSVRGLLMEGQGEKTLIAQVQFLFPAVVPTKFPVGTRFQVVHAGSGLCSGQVCAAYCATQE